MFLYAGPLYIYRLYGDNWMGSFDRVRGYRENPGFAYDREILAQAQKSAPGFVQQSDNCETQSIVYSVTTSFIYFSEQIL